MNRILHGIVHGKMIELTEPHDIPDGESVQVVIRATPPARPWGEGILASAGAWADYPEMDEVMQKIQDERKLERRSQGLE